MIGTMEQQQMFNLMSNIEMTSTHLSFIQIYRKKQAKMYLFLLSAFSTNDVIPFLFYYLFINFTKSIDAFLQHQPSTRYSGNQSFILLLHIKYQAHILTRKNVVNQSFKLYEFIIQKRMHFIKIYKSIKSAPSKMCLN